MKQQLDSETRAAMVDYRLERAHSTLGEADLYMVADISMPLLIAYIMLVTMLLPPFC